MRGSAARAFLSAVVVLVLVGVVAIAATGSTPAGSGDSRPPSYVLFDTIFTLSLVALLASAAFLVYVLAHREPTDSPRTRSGLLVFLWLAALAALFATTDVRSWLLSQQGEGEQPQVTTEIPNISEGVERPDRPGFAWLPAAVVVALVMIGVAAMLLAERRRRARGNDRKGADEAVVQLLDDTLDDLRRERDPRRAVIAAYARLERGLAAYGLPRGPAETQVEYVARILGGLDVDRTAVQRLTDLFSQAKFSQHTVDAGMKEEAIAALEQVRGDLRAGSAAPQAPRAETAATGVSS